MRRRRSHADSLDSLLDVMLNILGLLIILLAALQMNVGQGLRRSERTNLEERIAFIRTEISTAAARTRDLSTQLEDLRTRIDAVDSSPSTSSRFSEMSTEWRSLARRTELVEQEVVAERDLVAALSEQLARLEQQLDSGRSVEVLPGAAVVEVYDPSSDASKPAWMRMKRVDIICHNGRIFRVDDETLEGLAKRAIETAARKAGSTQNVATLRRYFDERDIGDEFVRLRISSAGRIRYELRAASPSESALTLLSGQSVYENQLEDFGSPRATWLKFHVWDDSFHAYSVAREIAEGHGYRVGWLPYAMDQILERGGSSTREVVGPDSLGAKN